MTPRPRQQEAIDKTEFGFLSHKRLIGIYPTGGGKTLIFSWLAKRRLERSNERTLILAHREELVDQAIDKLQKATGIYATKEKAESWASKDSPVVVGSIQTVNKRFARWDKNHFGLVVCDESHHILSAQWQNPLAYFSAQVLGVTATPDRGDLRDVRDFFDAVAFEVGLFDLINDGHLAKISVKTVPLKIDLTRVGLKKGDYDAVALGSALEPYLDEIAAAIVQHASFRKVLAFLPLIATSQKFVGACQNAGLAAQHIDGESPDRKEILARYSAGEWDVLSNAMLLLEGYDEPTIDCVAMLRPTKIRSLYSQAVGRGTRIASGKDDLLLLDFLWNHKRLALCHPAHLISKSEDEAEAITLAAQDVSHAVPGSVAALLAHDLQKLGSTVQAQREAALRAKLEANSKKRGQYISAEEFAVQHSQFTLAGYEPTMKWELEAVSDKQAKVIRRAGIDLSTVSGKGHASQLIDIIVRETPIRMASDGAAEFIRKRPGLAASMGIDASAPITAQQAGRFFAQLKAKKNE
jgi:superfamily II DNA or RNA helicase